MHFFVKKFGHVKKKQYFCTRFRKEAMLFNLIEEENAEIAQLVEHDLAKVGVASSSLVFRSFFFARMAELVDACVSGAHAARCAGSSPVLGTRLGYYSRDSQ